MDKPKLSPTRPGSAPTEPQLTPAADAPGKEGGTQDLTRHKASHGTAAERKGDDAFVRAEREDDDGYDPYSDRPADPEPLFEEDPWR